MESTAIAPKARAMSFTMGGPIPYRVQCFQPYHQLVREEPQTLEGRIERLTKGKNIERVFLPRVEHMSARRAHFREFTIRRFVGSVEVLESESPSDLVALRPHQGILFRNGGCLLLVATGGGYCIAGHAGRDSLVRPDGDDREFESVVHAIGASFDRKGIDRSHIVLRAYFGIQPQVFPHDYSHERGSYYARVVEKLERLEARARKHKGWDKNASIVTYDGRVPHLNLYLALKAQALTQDITRVGYEKPLPINKDFAYTRHENPELATARNCVFAYRER